MAYVSSNGDNKTNINSEAKDGRLLLHQLY